MTAELPFEAPSPLLEWLPGETLFSLASRHDRFWGYASSWRATLLLFGGRHAGTHHDFPNALGEFVARTEGVFGDACRIAQDRTLLKYYRPFLGSDEVAAAAETMQGATVAHLKFRLGLLTSSFRANHPLKACRNCMGDDLTEQGWVYWHLAHQYPGVWVCTRHGEPLLTSTVKSTGVERFLWHLPMANALSQEWRPSVGSDLEPLASLGALTTALVEHPAMDGWLQPLLVQKTLRIRLAERGWITPHGNARLEGAAADYLRHCAALRVSPELVSLPANLEDAKVQIGRLIRPLRSGTHPIRLLVAIDWLFGGATDFVNSHSVDAGLATADQLDNLSRPAHVATAPADMRRVLLHDLLQAGETVSAAAMRVGIDVGTAMAWAAQAGIEVGRRPKVLKVDLRASLVRDLSNGVDKTAAAETHGVSIQTVTRVLRTQVGLHAAWKRARRNRAQAEARYAWLGLLATCSAIGTKLMRAMNPAAYAWLYRNDKVWLLEHAAGDRIQATADRASSVRWDERDDELSRAVRRATLRLSQERPGRQLHLWQVYQAVPELKPKLSALDRLPLTKSALELAVGRRRSRSGGERQLNL